MALLSNLYILFLRLAHIAGGILWVGGAILYLFLLYLMMSVDAIIGSAGVGA